MVDIEFDLNQTKLIIQSNLDDPFQKAIDSYLEKSKQESGSIFFLSNGKQVNPKEPVRNYMGNKSNEMIQVLVYMAESDNKEKGQVIIKSEDIICPKCKEPCRITMEDFRIKLFGCIDGHITEDIKISEFAETQKINMSKIICDKCKIKNRGNCPKNDFYRCLTCQQNLCLLCRPGHDSSHNVIRYVQKNYICKKHNEPLINYCKECKKNICFSCIEHKNHETVFLGNLMPDMEQKKKILKEIKSMKDAINIKIQEIIEQLNGFITLINNYYDINSDILNNFDIKNRNYQNLENLNEINNNNIIYKKLKGINDNANIKDIIDLYKNIEKTKEEILLNKNIKNQKNEKTMTTKKIINENKINEIIKENANEITIIYNSLNKNEIRIFGNDFVFNNKSMCCIIIDEQKPELLCCNLKLNAEQKKQKTIIIKLQGINNITNMRAMFYCCDSLISLPDISKWNTKNVTDMSNMFYCCSSIISLPDISNWNTISTNNMYSMFYGCNSLFYLPDISKGDTKNVKDLSYMFYDCKLLTSIPNISEWNTKNVTDMSYMFYGCSSLKSLPDISNWDIKGVTNTSYMFYGCNSLLSLPYISKWEILNVRDMSYMFFGCSSLKSLPDITLWKMNKDFKSEGMFEGVDSKIIPSTYNYCVIY